MQCAIEVQRTFAKRNHDVLGERRIELKIGIHLGDVVQREGDVYGDGVNIASRIEPLAEPGGICLSQQVFDQVQNKFTASFVKLGAADLKNIQAPVNIYRLVSPWRKGRWSFFERLAFRLRQKKARAAVAATLVLLLLGAVIWATFVRSAPDPRALFQKAKALASHSSSHLEGRRNNPRVIKLLEKAVAVDPNFAEAHAELALAYVIRLFLHAPEDKELEQKAYLAVARALSLNANLPVAYLARGHLKWTPFHHFRREDAINDFQRTLALDSDLDEAHHYLGLVFLHVGLIEEARTEFKAAIASNPSNNGAQYRLGEHCSMKGDSAKRATSSRPSMSISIQT